MNGTVVMVFAVGGTAGYSGSGCGSGNGRDGGSGGGVREAGEQ